MRVFLAIEIPQDVKEKLAEIQEQLKPQISSVRWESPEKFHVTLIFLGKAEDKRLADLEEALREAQGKLGGPFRIRLSGLGFFPCGKHPRVVLVGVGEGLAQAVELQKRLAEALSDLRLDFARLSKPHLTLGRFKRGVSPTLRVGELGSLGNLGSFEVSEVVIIESTLRPTGSVYTPISRIPL